MDSRYFYLLLVFTFSICTGFSVNIEVSINETSSIIQLGDNSYSMIADGIIELRNPSNVSKVYEFELPLKFDTLIGINKVPLEDINETVSVYDNLTNTTTNVTTIKNFHSDKFLFQYNKIEGYLLEPNQTIAVKYHMFGILNYNVYDRLDSDQPILDYYIDSYNFRSRLILNLQKPQREGFEYNLNGSVNQTPLNVTNTTRLVSSEIRNPTDFEYLVKKVKIYRTEVAAPFIQDGEVISESKNFTIKPFEYNLIDFFDKNSHSSSVYWVSADSIIKSKFNFSKQFSFVDQRPSGGGNKKDKDNDYSGGGIIKIKDLSSVILKKDTDKTLVRNGEKFKVFLRIVNVNDYDMNDLNLYDEIPEGYEIEEVTESVKINNRELEFKIDELDAYQTKVIEYTLVSKKKDFKGITYLKPAELIYKEYNIFSDGIILINDLLPQEKVFVQKEVKYIDDKFAQVKIIVKNLGSYEIDNLLVSDFISDDATIKDISKIFHDGRGTWLIKTLNSGEEWEVTYMINRDADLDNLPEVFGVDKNEIYGTLISSEEVITVFKEQPHTIEKVGMGLAVGFLVLYLLF